MNCTCCAQELKASDWSCPACGHPVASANAAVVSNERLVAGGGRIAPIREHAAPGAVDTSIMASASRALVAVKSDPPPFIALSRLPALAWRQPAVRAAVRTGASALALSLALRLAGRWAMSHGARQMVRQAGHASLLPALSEMLNEGLDQGNGAHGVRGMREMKRRRTIRRVRRGQVTETLIFIRRTVQY
jgi:hypothetical protein